MEHHRLAFSGLEWAAIAPGARHKMFERNGKRVRLLEFSREFVELEWRRKGHVGVVLQGVLELHFDGRSERFNPGDGLFILAGKRGSTRRGLSASASRCSWSMRHEGLISAT